MVKKSQIVGVVMILAGIGLYFFGAEHNPNMGFGDMLTHLDGWMLSKPVYYVLMILAGLLVVVGAVGIFNGMRKDDKKG